MRGRDEPILAAATILAFAAMMVIAVAVGLLVWPLAAGIVAFVTLLIVIVGGLLNFVDRSALFSQGRERDRGPEKNGRQEAPDNHTPGGGSK